jgi:urate oxidase
VAIVLGPNRYGKAETRLVRVIRDGETHRLFDVNVTIALSGDLQATHLTGDNRGVLPTDTMKNTVYAFAKEYGISEPEQFALLLARHFLATQRQVATATVTIEWQDWHRLGPHSFQRDDSYLRLCRVDLIGDRAQVVSGLRGMVLMNTTGSEFTNFLRDRYTTLQETTDRILASSVDARWRHVADLGDWADSFAGARDALVDGFVNTYSGSLQQTLMSMGSHVLSTRPEIAEIRLALTNRHHHYVDLTPFGLANDNEVFVAGDRPYGLIEGTVLRDDAPPAVVEWYR